jgi:hypothetical protein
MELDLERAASDLEEAEWALKSRFQAFSVATSKSSTAGDHENDPRCVRTQSFDLQKLAPNLSSQRYAECLQFFIYAGR